MADYWSATISSLGKLIEKPSLTEERLTKPPFRFLRDIVASLIKSTGFPAGLYTDEEMDVENLKEKPARVAWVKKIIDATSYTIGQSVSANPAKVVAGSDPEQTNEWLQLLAQAATAPKGDQEKGVKKALAKADSKSEKKKDGDGKEKGKKEKDDKAGEGKGDKADAKAKDKDKDGKADGKDKKDRKDKDGEKDKPAKDGKEKKDKKDKKDKDEPPPPPEPIDPHAAMAAKLRPSTSRAGPPVKKDAVERVDATAESVSAQSHAQGVIRGGGGDGGDDDDDDEREIDVAAQHIREDAAALGAGNGDPAALGAADIENARAKMQIVREGEDDGLILTGTRKAKPRSTFDDEVHRMRQSLQSLVNSTQPLGKAMDYIQEDIDSMARELNLLRNETTQQNVLFLEQQKATDDATAPLHNKLMDLETDIGEQNQRTVLLKANIVANDETVKVLLRMVVMPDME